MVFKQQRAVVVVIVW